MFRPRRAEGNRLPRLRKNSQVRPAGRSSVIRTLLNHRIAAKAKGRNAARRSGAPVRVELFRVKYAEFTQNPKERRGYKPLSHNSSGASGWWHRMGWRHEQKRSIAFDGFQS